MSAEAPVAGRNVPGGSVVTPSGARIYPDTAAYAQFAGQFGIHGNAEDLIQAHRATVNPALQKASLVQVDADATKEAKEDLKGAAKKLGLSDDATLIDVTVRGHALIGVVEYPNGITRKVVGGWTDDYVAPELSPAQAADAAAAEREFELQQEVQRLQVEFAQRLDDMAVDNATKLNEEVTKLRESAEKEISKVRDKAEGDAEKQQEKATRRTSTRRRSGSRRKSSSRKASGSRKKTTSSSRKPGAKGDQRSPDEKANETKGQS